MEPDRTLAISSLRAQVFLGKLEERKLRTILADASSFKVKMKTQFDLNALLRHSKAQSDKLARLLAME
jgi:hypothetical protein